MHYKSLCKVMVAVMSLSLVVPNVAMALETETIETSSEVKPGGVVNTPETETPGSSQDGSGSGDIGGGSVTEAPTNPPTDTEVPSETETTPPETEPPTETEKPTEKPTEPGTDTEKPTEDPDQTEKPTELPTPSTDEGGDNGNTDPSWNGNSSGYVTNDSLIAGQQIVNPVQVTPSFRFVTVSKVYAIAAKKVVKVYSEKSNDSDTTQVVGKLRKNGLCFILKDEDSEWIYIESGKVRGFVKSTDLIIGEDAEAYVKEKTEKKMQLAEKLIEPLDNPALTYTKTTTRNVVVTKRYAIAKTEGLNIREENNEKGRVIGKLPEGALCYVLADAKKDWVYVESGDVRGFVKKDHLVTGRTAEELIKDYDEDEIALAKQLIEPEENAACYYTFTSIKKGTISSTIRDSIVSFAQQFVGNAYVWGGVSLTQGADCSGFVQSIYKQYGYTLPRVAEDQAQFGMKIPVSEALPGDLIFYAKDGYIHHVVMYIGDGKTVEAQSTATGIVNDTVNSGEAVWATRIISDEDAASYAIISSGSSQYTSATDSDVGQSLGTFKLTAYCACPICCGQWSGGPTASGAMPVQGRTVAMAGVPFGTKLVINGQIYTVEDRGTPYGHVDVYLNNHQEAVVFGVQYANVYMVK